MKLEAAENRPLPDPRSQLKGARPERLRGELQSSVPLLLSSRSPLWQGQSLQTTFKDAKDPQKISEENWLYTMGFKHSDAQPEAGMIHPQTCAGA